MKIRLYKPLILILFSYCTYAERITTLIPQKLHPLDETLIAVIDIPEFATTEQTVPACLIVHGSGGLFSAGEVGEDCDTSVDNIDSRYEDLMDLLAGVHVATLAPSSFVSRDPRFCEDNDEDYFQFVAPPFHHPNDGVPPQRDNYYEMRRIVIRTLDMFAGYSFLCSLENIDCSNTCMVGTSNGASTIFSYIGNDIGRHIKEYTDITQQREHETQSNFEDRITAFQNFPNLPENIDDWLNHKIEPKFANAISPGCFLRKLIPTITAGDSDFDAKKHMTDLYYPSGQTNLYLEIGTEDGIPDNCYDGGIRQIQASDYEFLNSIPLEDSKYIISTYENAPHNLLREEKAGQLIRDKIKKSAIDYFYLIFRNTFE